MLESSLRVIHFHRGLVWSADITLATRKARIILSSSMAGHRIQPMDISGFKSKLSERVWLRGLTYYAELFKKQSEFAKPSEEKKRITL